MIQELVSQLQFIGGPNDGVMLDFGGPLVRMEDVKDIAIVYRNAGQTLQKRGRYERVRIAKGLALFVWRG